ncbi:hypothetical protein FDECE_14291 [Fusarium decemcellulare]|nr:hypothetical protein FDECE_14291 [Fusarium decemcellulare]
MTLVPQDPEHEFLHLIVLFVSIYHTIWPEKPVDAYIRDIKSQGSRATLVFLRGDIDKHLGRGIHPQSSHPSGFWRSGGEILQNLSDSGRPLTAVRCQASEVSAELEPLDFVASMTLAGVYMRYVDWKNITYSTLAVACGFEMGRRLEYVSLESWPEISNRSLLQLASQLFTRILESPAVQLPPPTTAHQQVLHERYLTRAYASLYCCAKLPLKLLRKCYHDRRGLVSVLHARLWDHLEPANPELRDSSWPFLHMDLPKLIAHFERAKGPLKRLPHESLEVPNTSIAVLRYYCGKLHPEAKHLQDDTLCLAWVCAQEGFLIPPTPKNDDIFSALFIKYIKQGFLKPKAKTQGMDTTRDIAAESATKETQADVTPDT